MRSVSRTARRAHDVHVVRARTRARVRSHVRSRRHCITPSIVTPNEQSDDRAQRLNQLAGPTSQASRPVHASKVAIARPSIVRPSIVRQVATAPEERPRPTVAIRRFPAAEHLWSVFVRVSRGRASSIGLRGERAISCGCFVRWWPSRPRRFMRRRGGRDRRCADCSPVSRPAMPASRRRRTEPAGPTAESRRPASDPTRTPER